GRDARTSGEMFMAAAQAGLQSVGIDVIDCGMIPTPTAQLAVEHHRAGGGIVLTASHNPVEWNALKLVGPDGMFLDAEDAERVRRIALEGSIERRGWDGIGGLKHDTSAILRHIEQVMALGEVDVAAVKSRRFKVALDCARGVGGAVMPQLLESLGCEVAGLELETDGRFSRPPEPVAENLGALGDLVRDFGADIGMAVDPDGDRLALVDETGTPIGEDYTLAFAVKAVLSGRKGPVVTNLSTSQVVADSAAEFGVELSRSPVGEANVARAMLAAGAVIGGEGNGGVMLPASHLGRDAPVAAALVLTMLARSDKTVSQTVSSSTRYSIVKAKVPRQGVLDDVYERLARKFSDAKQDRRDGLHLSWEKRWLHVRPSGTEPIIRLIAEAQSVDDAEELVSEAQEALK
ncbi:MAG: phosphoglucosamine mutase, partial [Gemmatimonadota bacterium]|nr:phosphoglucosamine mutase [Gemmatimonadota bacterium]